MKTMTKYDAVRVLNISEMTVTKDVVVKAYRQAAKTFHPDINPAGANMMIMVNLAKETLLKESLPFDLKYANSSDYGTEINDALNAIVTFANINIEVCGSWVWVSGDTKPYRVAFKDAGFHWSGKKKMWYYRPQYAKRRFKGKQMSMDQIRNKYGSTKVDSRETRKLG